MLNDCPYCHSDQVFLHKKTASKPSVSGDITQSQVVCSCCDMSGPTFYGQTPDRAIETWNKLSYEH